MSGISINPKTGRILDDNVDFLGKLAAKFKHIIYGDFSHCSQLRERYLANLDNAEGLAKGGITQLHLEKDRSDDSLPPIVKDPEAFTKAINNKDPDALATLETFVARSVSKFDTAAGTAELTKSHARETLLNFSKAGIIIHYSDDYSEFRTFYEANGFDKAERNLIWAIHLDQTGKAEDVIKSLTTSNNISELPTPKETINLINDYYNYDSLRAMELANAASIVINQLSNDEAPPPEQNSLQLKEKIEEARQLAERIERVDQLRNRSKVLVSNVLAIRSKQDSALAEDINKSCGDEDSRCATTFGIWHIRKPNDLDEMLPNATTIGLGSELQETIDRIRQMEDPPEYVHLAADNSYYHVPTVLEPKPKFREPN